MAIEPRPVYAYELHGHDSDGPLDYELFFSLLFSLPPIQRRFVISSRNEVVAIPEIRREREGRYELRFVIGREGDIALFYDMATGEEREAQPREGEVAVQTSWIIIDTTDRLAIQERRRPGVPLQLAIDCLVGVARDQGLADNPTLSLHPVVSESFIDELDELDRIKSATIVLNRPNMSWLDAADSILAAAADDSNAGSVELGATARPKESLAKDTGIIADIKTMVKTNFSALKRASVEGRAAGELRNHKVSTRNHAMRKEVQIPEDATRAQERDALLTGANEYVDELRQRREAREIGEAEAASATSSESKDERSSRG